MGMRSQIYVRLVNPLMNGDTNKPFLVARYFQWNYGERMISRARYTAEWLLARCRNRRLFDTEIVNLQRIIDTNFDMHDVTSSCDIIKEYEEDIELYASENKNADFSQRVFRWQDNNNGKAFIDVKDDGVIKYAFTDYDLDLDNIMSAEKYISNEYDGDWTAYVRKNLGANAENIIATCEANTKYIQDNCTLMTRAELEDFLDCDYSNIPVARKLIEGRVASREECMCYFAFYIQHFEERRLLPLPGKTSFADIARYSEQFADELESSGKPCDGDAALEFCVRLRQKGK